MPSNGHAIYCYFSPAFILNTYFIEGISAPHLLLKIAYFDIDVCDAGGLVVAHACGGITNYEHWKVYLLGEKFHYGIRPRAYCFWYAQMCSYLADMNKGLDSRPGR